MVGKTHAHSDSILNLLRGVSVTNFGTTHIALFTFAPTDTGGGTESAYGSDGRQPIIPGEWDAPINGPSIGRRILSNVPISWTAWDGGTETMVAAGIFDITLGGVLLYHALLATSRTINDGETATFAAGALIVQED
jgi:hypothetical protein